MPDITIGPIAAKFIAEKLNDAALAASHANGTIPRLKLASRLTWHGSSGEAMELGPRFLFSWTKPEECLEEGDSIVDINGIGKLALAPGSLLNSGGRSIEVSGDHLVVIPPIKRP